MQYTQTKEQSAELLRVVLARFGQHDATFNPLTFAVWYEYAAGINPGLTRALDHCLQSEPRLGDATIVRLYQDHVGGADAAALQRASGGLQQVMAGMAESAARTGDQAGLFGAQLGGLTQALRDTDAQALAPLLSQALAGSAEMQDSATTLQRQVAASREEIDRLRTDLTRAREEALVDPLTKLLNRKGYDQLMQALLQQPPRPGCAHCLVLLDIDRFKHVNDTYGHVMGDRLLQVVAEALRISVMDASHRVARYGGEEFAVLMPHSTAAKALAQAEAMRQQVKALKVRDRRSQNVVLTVTVSAGVATLQPGDDAVGLVARADGALYAAKEAGRDRVRCA